MGLLGEGISEVIATTRYNAAPMGIINRGGKFSMVVFRGSHTAANVERDGWVVANLSSDPRVYVKTAFGDLPSDEFEELEAGGRRMHRLKGAEAWIAFDAHVEHRSDVAISVRLTPLKEEVILRGVRPVNRGFNSVIEATIHATRYRMSGDPRLLELIRHHLSIVHRCGGVHEREAAEMLAGLLGLEDRGENTDKSG